MNILKKKDNELPGVQEWWVGLKRKEDDIENWVWTDGSLANKSSLWVGQLVEDQHRTNAKQVYLGRIDVSKPFVFIWMLCVYLLSIYWKFSPRSFFSFLIQEDRSHRRMIGAFWIVQNVQLSFKIFVIVNFFV